VTCQYNKTQILCQEPCKKCNKVQGLKTCRVCQQTLILALAFRQRQGTCKECEKKEKGPTQMGRPRSFSREVAFKLLDQGRSASDLELELGCSQPTAWRLREEWKELRKLSVPEGHASETAPA